MSTQTWTDSAACTVCGQAMAGKSGVTDPKGRPVCGDCIEAARQLVARRESRKRQVDALRKSESDLARVEHDNSAVLHISEEEVLALSKYACASCGRVIQIADMGCDACGFGTSLMNGSSRKRRLFSFKLRGPTSQTSTLFPLLDARIVSWIGTGALALGVFTPVIAMLVRWMWEGAIVLALGLTLAAAGLLAFARQQRPATIAVHALGALVICVLLVRGLSGPTSQTLVVWLAVGVPAIAMQLWSMLTGGDEWLVRRSVAASLLAQVGLVAFAIIRCTQTP